MEKEKIDLTRVPLDRLVRMFRQVGVINVTEETLRGDVAAGFPCREPDFINILDYFAWLYNKGYNHPEDFRIVKDPFSGPELHDDEHPFNPQDYDTGEMFGYLSDHNSFDAPVESKGRFQTDWREYESRLKAKDKPGHINFLKYLAFLAQVKHRKINQDAATGYDAKKGLAFQRSRELSQAGRDIGDLPEVADAERKKRCGQDFRLFCETYFSHTFSLEWSPDHLRVIAKIEDCVLRGGQFALAMPRGSGKALALDTPLPTPDGWTTMGAVKIGDLLFDEHGNPCTVVRKSEVFTDHDCYNVSFSDGASIVCDAGHLWQVEDIFGRKNPYVRTTEWLASRYKIGKRGYHESRFRIPMQKPLQIQKSYDLPIAPYAFGIWLGDGTCSGSSICLCDKDSEEIIQNAFAEKGNDNITVCDFGKQEHAVTCRLTKSIFRNRNKSETGQAKLRLMGVLKNKHIPSVYLRANYEDRLSLLQGMMDTDGTADAGGHAEICIKYKKLADNFAELLSSLGIKFGVSMKNVMLDGKEYGPCHRFYINGYKDQHIFRLKRKQDMMRSRPGKKMTKLGSLSHTPCDVRMIVNIEKVPTVPTQCVMVDSPSHLYLAGNKMVPTHNSSLAETAGVWSILYGHRDFVALIGATEGAAVEMMESIKTELESNEMLAADFPEVCFPIKQLDGIANRCAGQLYHGERTRITWTANEIVLPTIENSPASGMIIRVAGITGRVRGMKFKRSDGRTARPSLVIVDDPQTTESANSIEQTRKRVRILVSDVLGLAGPGQKIAGLMPCTIIKVGDMADQILDRSKHPEWNGERTKMLYAPPVNVKLWEEYSEIRADALREDGNIDRATAFYKEHQTEMDAGAEVAWKARFNHDEISALQHAMNLKLTDELAFQAEYQNDPMPDDSAEDTLLSVDEICGQINGLKRGIVPLACTHVTMFVDIQKTLLFWCVAAWADDFTGAVIDYGAWPDQNRVRFSLADANPTFQQKFPKAGLEGQIYAALEALFKEQMPREFLREDGAVFHVERAMIDANWGASTDVVYQFCRQCGWSGTVMPGHGRYIGASSRPMTEYKKKKGERLGFNWFMPAVTGKRAIRHVVFDTNFWKSFVHSRLSVAMGDKGNLSLFGKNPLYHQLFAEHLTAEYRVKTQGLGRTVDEWKLRAAHEDNHWLDCLAGCAVCASMTGAAIDVQLNAVPKKPRLTLSEGPKPAAPEPVAEPVKTAKKVKICLSDLQKKR